MKSASEPLTLATAVRWATHGTLSEVREQGVLKVLSTDSKAATNHGTGTDSTASSRPSTHSFEPLFQRYCSRERIVSICPGCARAEMLTRPRRHASTGQVLNLDAMAANIHPVRNHDSTFRYFDVPRFEQRARLLSTLSPGVRLAIGTRRRDR